jgi:GNAT superfamily N-acetyltransferase
MTTTNRRAEYIIRRGRSQDFIAYLKACQASAYQAYSTQGPNLFTEFHYFHPTIMPYWESLAQNDGNRYWWVAELQAPKSQIVGGIGLKTMDDSCEGYGFYVSPEWQAAGIGRSLWQARQKFVTKPLLFEVYSHATKTIDRHLKHGARHTGNQRLIHWESWPDDIYLTALEFIAS